MGSIKIIKHRNSQSYRIGKPGEDFTLTEIFHVTWIPANDADPYPGDGTILASASNTAITGTRVPKVQERYAGCDANLSFLVCESVDWRVNPEARHSWTVTANWASRMEFAYQSLPEPWTRITRVGGLRQGSHDSVDCRLRLAADHRHRRHAGGHPRSARHRADTADGDHR
jgi:hypothetical protein